MTMPNRVLYKFMPPERKDVLQTFMIRYTQPAYFNDYFDIYPRLLDEELMKRTKEKFAEDVHKIKSKHPSGAISNDFLDNIFNENVRMIMNQQNTFAQNLLPIWQRFRELIGVLCLSENSKNQIMWARYASDNRGFALGLNVNHPGINRSEGEFFSRPIKVEYSKERQILRSRDSFPKAFFHKNEIWRDEKEWRIIRKIESADHHFEINNQIVSLFKIPEESIVSLILGAKIEEQIGIEIINSIINNRRLHNLDLFVCMPCKRSFSFDFGSSRVPG